MPPLGQKLDGVGQVHLVDMVIAARHANAVGRDHHIRMAATLGRLKPIAGKLKPQALLGGSRA